MEELAEFTPYLTGAVLNGTAGEHDDIHLQLFAESAKEVAIFLMNRNVQYRNVGNAAFHKARRRPVETVSFLWRQDGVHLALYDYNDLRGALKPGRPWHGPQRADLEAVRALLPTNRPANEADALFADAGGGARLLRAAGAWFGARQLPRPVRPRRAPVDAVLQPHRCRMPTGAPAAA